jgi:hypothetical protein
VKQTPTLAYTPNPTDAQGNPVSGTIYAKRTSIPGVSNPSYLWQEDPHIWRSGGTYHVVYSGSGDRVGWHVYSPDGLSWKDNGYAWSPRDYKKIFCYEGSTTCNAWYKMERPGVVLQDGHPTHMTWAVSDVDKDNQVTPGTNHGTKVIVVPFDGVAFDNDFGTGGGGGTGTGGSNGSGGATGAGGATGRGGAAGLDGGSGSGGARGNDAGGGDVASDGSSGTGGTSASGGSSGSTSPGATGGAGGGKTGPIATGGYAAGGSSSGGHGGSQTGGAPALGGSVASGGSSSTAKGGNGGSTSTGPTTSNDSGCGCVVGSASRGGAWLPTFVLSALAILIARRRNRRG